VPKSKEVLIAIPKW